VKALPLSRERCRTDALLIRVKMVQSDPFFANTANAPLTSQLDSLQEREGRAVQRDGMVVPSRRKKKGSKSHACG